VQFVSVIYIEKLSSRRGRQLGRRLDARGREWNPFYRALLLKHRPSGCYQVKFDQSREPITSKIKGPGCDVMKHANLANHGSDAKNSGHFAAARV
jgi:hypothetical protein